MEESLKLTNKQVTLDDVEQLLDDLKLVDWYNDRRKEYLVIVSKSGFTNKAKQLMELKNVVRLGVKELEGIILNDKKMKWN